MQNKHRLANIAVVVKKCLHNALKDDLPLCVRDHFTHAIQDMSELMSRLSRRASLCFLFYVTYAKEHDWAIPDFKNVEDSYWKKWMRLGIKEFGNETISPEIHDVFAKIHHLVGTSLRDDQIDFNKDIPEYFDRVLGHAAIQFKTSVLNLLQVNFISKLQRLCKLIAHREPDQSVSKFSLLQAIRNNEIPAQWSHSVKHFATSVRNRLKLEEHQILYDDTNIDFITRVDFHWWMQQRFEEMEERKIRMCPITKITRSHIRLDATLLYVLSWKAIKTCELDLPNEPVQVQKPLKRMYSSSKEYSSALRSYEEYKSEQKQYENESKKIKAKWRDKYPSIQDMDSRNPKDPKKELYRRLKLIPIGKRPDKMDEEVWKVESEKMKKKNEEIIVERNKEMETDEFKRKLRVYQEHESQIHNFAINTLFKPFEDKKSKHGWKPAASVSTDGVSLSILYEKTIEVPMTNTNEKNKKKKTSLVNDGEFKSGDNYDPHENTVVDDTLVLGVDPGRTQIVTIICIDAKNKKHVWKLSRGEYYAKSETLAENKRQQRRYKELEKEFATLTASGGCVKAVNSEQVYKYIEACSRIQRTWWSVALKRVESRSKMKRYIGKRKVLDSFFSRVRKEANDLCGERMKVQVAYGSAARTMPCTGKGEVACPVGDAFKTCARIFKGQTTPEDENYSTKVSWETKKTKEIAYLGVRDGEPVLCHSKGKRPPVVKKEDETIVSRMIKESKERRKRRTSWNRGSAMTSDAVYVKREQKKCKEYEMRYLECRGLRFCPERSKYYDRDASSARAIAGLRCLKLKGFRRPVMFTRAGHLTITSSECPNLKSTKIELCRERDRKDEVVEGALESAVHGVKKDEPAQ